MYHVIQPMVFDGSEQRQQLKSTRRTVNNYNGHEALDILYSL